MQKRLRVLQFIATLLVMVALLNFGTGCKKEDSSSTKEKTTEKMSGAKTTATIVKTTSTVKKTGTSTNAHGVTVEETDWKGGEETENTEDNFGEEEPIDMQGRTIVWKSWRDFNKIPNTPAVTEVCNNFMKMAEEKYNCKIEFQQIITSIGMPQEYMNAALAGIKFADVFEIVASSAFPVLTNKNLLLEIDQYLDFSTSPWNEPFIKNGSWMGRMYGLTPPLTAEFGVFYNKDIFSAQGLPDLHDLKDSGNWNWDSFLEIGVSTTRDFNGDGIVDQWGLVAHPVNLGLSLCMSNGSDYVLETGDSIQFSLDQTKALHALQFYSDLFNVYKITPYNTWWGAAQKLFAANKVAMAIREGWAGKSDFIPFNLNFGFEVLPKGPDVDEHRSISLGGGCHVFPYNIEEPEHVVKAFAEFWAWWDETKPGYMTASDIIRSWGSSNMPSEREIQAFLETSSIQVVSRARHFPDMNTIISGQILNKIATMEKSVSNAVDSAKQSAQAAIDNSMAQ